MDSADRSPVQRIFRAILQVVIAGFPDLSILAAVCAFFLEWAWLYYLAAILFLIPLIAMGCMAMWGAYQAPGLVMYIFSNWKSFSPWMKFVYGLAATFILLSLFGIMAAWVSTR